MMLAPIVNYAVETALKVDDRRSFWMAIVPIILLVFGWGGMVAMPGIGKFMPSTAGVTAYSGITLLGVYVAARVFRCFDLERKITTKRMFVAFPILFFLVGPCRFCEYSTPVALLLSACALVCFKRIHVSFALNWLTPSLFAVYFYHTLKHGNRWLETALEGCLNIGMPLIAAYFIAGLVVFVGCVAFDVPRRLSLLPIKKPVVAVLSKIDRLYEGLFE